MKKTINIVRVAMLLFVLFANALGTPAKAMTVDGNSNSGQTSIVVTTTKTQNFAQADATQYTLTFKVIHDADGSKNVSTVELPMANWPVKLTVGNYTQMTQTNNEGIVEVKADKGTMFKIDAQTKDGWVFTTAPVLKGVLNTDNLTYEVGVRAIAWLVGHGFYDSNCDGEQDTPENDVDNNPLTNENDLAGIMFQAVINELKFTAKGQTKEGGNAIFDADGVMLEGMKFKL